jgi:glycosyltransferase involved in cell wall biosynthesis
MEDERPAPRHRFAYVDMQPEAGTAFTHDWPGLIEARRGMRRILRDQLPDVVHLRMADVGSLAAAEVAAELGIPTVFTLAPDPHALINAAEESGRLDRRSFAAADATQALWYRVDLVRRLTRQAAHVVLFPRDNLANQLRDLAGIDLAAERGRFTVVPEGVDVAPIRAAASATTLATSSAARDLMDRIARLSPERHGLPLVVSIGRLVEVKGMSRLVEAFASDAELQRRANLVIVGGDLEHPTAEEQAELDRMQRLMAEHAALRGCLILLGHRPNRDVPDILAVARHGQGSLVGAGGAYAAASRKEEFGLAIVEALAAGLPVVAPVAGGPSTYVEQGRTGYLVDTTDPLRLAAAVRGALDLAFVPGRAEYAAVTIGRKYDIRAMAGALVPIYADAVPARSLERAS